MDPPSRRVPASILVLASLVIHSFRGPPPAAASPLTIAPSGHGEVEGIKVSPLTGSSLSCVYLEQSKGLDCACPAGDSKVEDIASFSPPLEVLEFPPQEWAAVSLVNNDSNKNQSSDPAAPGRDVVGPESPSLTTPRLDPQGPAAESWRPPDVATIKVHSCPQANLILNLGNLGEFPLYKIRIEDIKDVRIGGLIVRPFEHLDIDLSRISGSLKVEGEVLCPLCTTSGASVPWEDPGSEEASNSSSLPVVRIRASEVADVSLLNFAVGHGFESDISLQVRGAGSGGTEMLVQDSFFNRLAASGLQVFDVDNITVVHSEFPHSSTGSLVVNGGVKHLVLKDSLIDRPAVLALDTNNTVVVFNCTISPTLFHMLEQEHPECASTMAKWATVNYGVETTGAIVLAVISALVLLLAVAVLVFLQRTGKLERYL